MSRFGVGRFNVAVTSLDHEKMSSWRDETQLNDERLLTTGAPP